MSVAANANALIDFAYAKALAGFPDTDQDKIQALINTASATAERITRRKLAARDLTEIRDGNGTNVLVLREYPVNSVSHLYLDPVRKFGADTEIDATRFLVKKDEGMIVLYDTVFSPFSGEGASYYGATKSPLWIPGTGAGIVKIVYNAGLSPIPDDLQNAALELVLFYLYRSKGGVGQRSQTTGDGMNVGYEIDVPVHVRSVLNDYARPE